MGFEYSTEMLYIDSVLCVYHVFCKKNAFTWMWFKTIGLTSLDKFFTLVCINSISSVFYMQARNEHLIFSLWKNIFFFNFVVFDAGFGWRLLAALCLIYSAAVHVDTWTCRGYWWTLSRNLWTAGELPCYNNQQSVR